MGNAEHKRIRLLIANSHQVIHEGLRCMLTGNPEIEVIGCTKTIPETIRLVGECEPDVLLIDPHIPGQDGMRAIELIHGEWPQVAILVFTNQQHKEYLLRALHTGVSAYLTLQTEKAVLLHAIHTATKGQTLLQPEYVAHLLACIATATATTNDGMQHTPARQSELTGREREVLHRVASGERNKEIAARLRISEPTVKSHLASIYFKLGVDSRAAAVAVGLEKGILSLQKRYL